MYPVLPYAQGYVRLANEKGMRGLIDEVMSRLSLSEKTKAILGAGFSALKLDPVGLMKAYIDIELRSYLNAKPRNASLHGVLLHEVVTDLCLGLKEVHLLDAFANHVREKYHTKPGFVTYNLVSFVELFQKAGLTMKDVVIMTPFNSIGYQMSPSRESSETCLSAVEGGDVIAMSILAGGYLNMDQAFDYIRKWSKLSGIAVGVSSNKHAQETFTKFRTLSQGNATTDSN